MRRKRQITAIAVCAAYGIALGTFQKRSAQWLVHKLVKWIDDAEE